MSSRRRRSPGQGSLHGVLVVDKPSGPTSHDVVATARRHFGTRRVGHAGTLDPLATGVLVLLLGEGTKLSAYLTRDAKRYVAEVAFGSATTTLDAQGVVTRRKDLPAQWLKHAALEEALHGELARTLQVPPSVSAIKVAGKPAHARVRRGEELELAPRDVRLHAARIVHFDAQRAIVELTVSKGYYVRAFARDLGDALGVPAHLASLRRTQSGPFPVDGAAPFPFSPEAHPLTLAEAARRAFATVDLSESELARVRNGQALSSPADHTPIPSSPAPVACLYEGRLVALAEPTRDGTLRIVRGFHDGGQADLRDPEVVITTEVDGALPRKG